MRLRGKRSSELLIVQRLARRDRREAVFLFLDEDQEMTFGGLPLLALFGRAATVFRRPLLRG